MQTPEQLVSRDAVIELLSAEQKSYLEEGRKFDDFSDKMKEKVGLLQIMKIEIEKLPAVASPTPDIQGELVAAARKADTLLQNLLADDSSLQFEVWPVLGELQSVLAKLSAETTNQEG